MDREPVLPLLLDRLAAERPDSLFVTEADTGREVTHGQFGTLRTRCAGGFRSLGVVAGDTVLLMLPTSIDAIALWLGIGRLRAMEVPVNPEYQGAMLAYVFQDSDARTLVTTYATLAVVVDVLDECPAVEHVVVVAAAGPLPVHPRVRFHRFEEFLEGAVGIEDLEYPRSHDIGAIVYTSGTTGPSKGVLMPWAQMAETARWMAPHEKMTASDVAYLPFPFYHITIKCPVYLMALLGGRLVVRERMSASTYWSDIRQHGATYTNLLGVMINMLLQQPALDDDADNPLRIVGVVPRPPSIREFEARFGVTTGTIFNMTEVSVPLVDYDGATSTRASCGRPRPGCEVRLVDEFDFPVPAGQIGELVVRTEEPWLLNAGYWRKPEATARAWRNGWFHTGDAFRVDESGDYFFVDRFKDAIRRRGENISSMEVEQLVLGNPAVAEAAALGVASPLGEEDLRIFVVRRESHSLSGEELLADLRNRMPAFMVPRYVEFVDELPKTPTYKIRKVALRDVPITEATFDRESLSSHGR